MENFASDDVPGAAADAVAAAKSRRLLVRWVVSAGVLMAFSYGALYFPYKSQALPVRLLTSYLHWLARGAGVLIGVVDSTAHVVGTTIQGRYPLEIVLDCGAVDAQALFVAAVVTFPVRWWARIAGTIGGVAVITAANLMRIVALYFIGVKWPTAFHFWHAEVFQLAMVGVAVLAFVAWTLWARSGLEVELSHAA